MSTPRRFFIGKINYPDDAEVLLSGDEFVHAKTVLRVEEGSEIVLLDGSGKEYSAIVTKVEKRCLSAHITGVTLSDKEPKEKIYLLCGALKGDKTELVIQKATELGVTRIGVFSSDYCSAYVNGNKMERLRRVAHEAAKQCLRAAAPQVEYFGGLQDALDSAKEYKNKLFACEFVGKSDCEISGLSGSTAMVVGSEGGFSEKELLAAREGGFTAITLGKRILRAETAAITLCSIAAYLLGELK